MTCTIPRIGELIDCYVMYLRDHKKRRSNTVQTTGHQLRGLLGPVKDMPAQALTARRAAALYKERAAKVAAGHASRQPAPGSHAVALGGKATAGRARNLG